LSRYLHGRGKVRQNNRDIETDRNKYREIKGQRSEVTKTEREAE
jgi:hypothetical protein